MKRYNDLVAYVRESETGETRKKMLRLLRIYRDSLRAKKIRNKIKEGKEMKILLTNLVYENATIYDLMSVYSNVLDREKQQLYHTRLKEIEDLMDIEELTDEQQLRLNQLVKWIQEYEKENWVDNLT